MKKILLALCLVALSAGARAQQIIKGETINDFTTVTLSGTMSVEMILADKPSVSMELNGVKSELLTWGVTNKQLTVKLRPQKEGTLAVKIYYTKLEEIHSNGADVAFTGTLKADMFTAEASSGAKITATLDCLDFSLRLTGNSAAQLDGQSRYVTLEATQRSKIDARQLSAVSALAKSYMYSEIYVWSTERVVAETNTGSAIFYRGEPTLLRTLTKLGGNVNNIGK